MINRSAHKNRSTNTNKSQDMISIKCEIVPLVPLVGVTDFDSGVDGFSSIFLFEGVDAFEDVPDRGECGPNRSGCSIFLSSKPFSRGEWVPPLLLCAFGIGLIALSDASSTTKS